VSERFGFEYGEENGAEDQSSRSNPRGSDAETGSQPDATDRAGDVAAVVDDGTVDLAVPTTDVGRRIVEEGGAFGADVVDPRAEDVQAERIDDGVRVEVTGESRDRVRRVAADQQQRTRSDVPVADAGPGVDLGGIETRARSDREIREATSQSLLQERAETAASGFAAAATPGTVAPPEDIRVEDGEPVGLTDRAISERVAAQSGIDRDNVVVADGEVFERATATNVLDDQTFSDVSITDIEQEDGGFTLTEQAGQAEQRATSFEPVETPEFVDEPGTGNVNTRGQTTVSPTVGVDLEDQPFSDAPDALREDFADLPGVQGTADAVQGVRDRAFDVFGPAAATAGDVATSPAGQAALFVGSTAAPFSPPVNPATARAAQAGAVAAGTAATGALANELDLPDRNSELDIPAEAPAASGELEPGTPQQQEITVPAGQQQTVGAGELGIPDDQLGQAEIVRGPDGAEITDDGEIIIPAEATQVAAGQRLEDEDEESDDEEDDEDAEDEASEEAEDEEIFIEYEGERGEDILDESEVSEVVGGESVADESAESDEPEIFAPAPQQGTLSDDVEPTPPADEGFGSQPEIDADVPETMPFFDTGTVVDAPVESTVPPEEQPLAPVGPESETDVTPELITDAQLDQETTPVFEPADAPVFDTQPDFGQPPANEPAFEFSNPPETRLEDEFATPTETPPENTFPPEFGGGPQSTPDRSPTPRPFFGDDELDDEEPRIDIGLSADVWESPITDADEIDFFGGER